MVCVYHSADLDGWSSAAIVKRKFPDVELIGYDYSKQIPTLPDDDSLILVDISFPIKELVELSKLKDIIWIDHHTGIIKEFNALSEEEKKPIKTIFPKDNELIAACELTWRYLFPDQQKPDSIELLGLYDCFRHKEPNQKFDDLTVMQYQYGARSLASNPEEALELIFDIPIEQVIERGIPIFAYLKKEATNIYKNLSFPMTILGNKFIAVNKERFNPSSFDIDYHADGYNGAVCFWYQDKQWRFSIYNENGKIDCSEIAKKFSGDGHSSASGFTMNKLPF